MASVDFILYLAVGDKENINPDETVATATHCQQEMALDRPVAGYCLICYKAIKTSKTHRKHLVSKIRCEILHALKSKNVTLVHQNQRSRP